ncbi:16S rRNA (uracil(1498)-N(3))-methyltransferase [Clostridium sp. MT-14]|jgi:16S rRNA (uracil1498-N3)-methyltransferase|uniref:Ribosomal RNA small subunit methyltransferase E n=1 Tax=Clostridium aromativorans TaxID=2836848 RepID=A0ABS8N358_9CLOT|nr:MULTISPECIES: 16S rRNA (uracil(1498)-N(3))-methyltransferase [Clostridium]KAA8669537.1 16S rRNA (uracil(1498)-N(3))-methyltransferase [Clostridium sp. HV4-5-A1G]MCC9294218.1 16S rRNA (uracil(1498)-N(3))-methyltransferase [Clostridium aromativorans]CAB1240538.1 Ribosomal RNA small subunit methyltransferase E [Clostridiaceae bacterium BL-3]
MNKFFVPEQDIHCNTAFIKGDDVKHINKVLRLQCGDKVNINNCDGKEFLGTIESVERESVTVKIIEEIELCNESPVKMYLFQALPKSSKMDLIVQKATEIGAYEITPVITRRVVVKVDFTQSKKAERWNKIAKEACKQCKRSRIPVVDRPIDFKGLLQSLVPMDLIFVPYENEKNLGIRNVIDSIDNRDTIKKVAVVIGPEGGFEENEIELLKNMNSHIVTLGPRIFRTETAGFVSLALLMYELGDLGGIIR